MVGALSGLCLVLSLAGLVTGCYYAALRLLPAESTSVRLCATNLLVMASMVVAFFVLSPLRAFGQPATAALSVALLAIVCASRHRRRAIRASVVATFRAFVWRWRRLNIPTRALVIGVVGIVVLAMLPRSLVSPPLGWDDLTYHLFKAGSWVQAARFRGTSGPDDWLRYDYYPGSGEVLWSWVFLPARDGAFLGLASCVVWFGLLLSAYTAARTLDLDGDRATTAALALASVPAAALAVEVSYVDNLEVVGFLTGVTFLGRCFRRFSLTSAGFALLGFWFAAGVKASGLLFVVLGLACTLVLAAVRQRSAAVVGLVGLLAAATSIVAIPWYARATLQQGSPLYPMPAPLLRDRLPANQQQIDILEGHLFGEERSPTSFGSVVEAAVFIERALRSEPLGLSWAPVPGFWIAGALIGAAYSLGRRVDRGLNLFLIAVAAATTTEIVSARFAGQREYFPFSIGRLVLPLLATLVLVTMRLPWRRWLVVPQVVVAAQLAATAISLGSSWSSTDTSAIFAAGACVAPAALIGAVMVAAFARRRCQRFDRGSKAVASLLLVGVLVAVPNCIQRVRSERRDELYAAAARGETSRFGPLGQHACAYPLWEAVVGLKAKIALTVGFGPGGHNLFRFPFLGPELENEVEYVPITQDGTFVDRADRLPASVVDEAAWLARLRERGIDYVAVLEPLPPEASVIERHPELFEPVARSTCDTSTLYRFRPPG